MKTVTTLLNAASINAACEATFALYGMRAQTFAVAAIRAACKTAGIQSAKLSKEELLERIAECLAFLQRKGCPPCSKDGTPHAGKRLTQWSHEVARALGPKPKKGANANKPQGVVESDVDPSVTVSNPRANADAPHVYHDSVVVPEMRALADELMANKSPKVKRLAELVATFFAE